MSHIWEHEEEYLQLQLDINRAKRQNNTILLSELQARHKLLDDSMWQSLTERFRELHPFVSVGAALAHTATTMGVPYPQMDISHVKTNNGRFIYILFHKRHGIQVWPILERGYYSVELYIYNEHTSWCFRGHSTSLMETTHVVSLWLHRHHSIDDIHELFSWMSSEPFQHAGPRMTFD